MTYINYNAKGQREIIEYGNGAHTHYTYDPLTFRMIHLLTGRKHDHARLQDLNYTFDPVGNITSICDDAQETIYFQNHVVSPSNDYVYDAIYRLISADGREHAGRPGQPQTTDDAPRMNQPLPSDGHALHRYREQYEYDAVGNILKLLHSASDGNWSRFYLTTNPRPEEQSAHEHACRQGRESYAYDADGNMTRMQHLPQWIGISRISFTPRAQETHTGRGETTYYVYDSSGQRVRKVTERASGSRIHERVYLGGFEVYREFDSVGKITLERETLHVIDDKRRIALVETKTIDADRLVEEPDPQLRYQFENHLGSSSLELDQRAAIISYEEYYPYGSTSFEASESTSEKVARKRYRYTGKERDEETGFYYHGARYYASWLGRWTAADPAGIAGGLNLYEYAKENPLLFKDPSGRISEEAATKLNTAVTVFKEQITRAREVLSQAPAEIADREAKITAEKQNNLRLFKESKGQASEALTKSTEEITRLEQETVSIRRQLRSAESQLPGLEARGAQLLKEIQAVDPAASGGFRVAFSRSQSLDTVSGELQSIKGFKPGGGGPTGGGGGGAPPPPADPPAAPPAPPPPDAPPAPHATESAPAGAASAEIEEGLRAGSKFKGALGIAGAAIGGFVTGIFVGKDLAEKKYGGGTRCNGSCPVLGEIVGLVRLIPLKVEQEQKEDDQEENRVIPRLGGRGTTDQSTSIRERRRIAGTLEQTFVCRGERTAKCPATS